MKNQIELGLSQWAFHRAILGDSRDDYDKYLVTLQNDPEKVLRGSMANRDIVEQALRLGVKVVDLVNLLFFSRASDVRWLRSWKQDAEQQGVRFACLMCDELGHLAASSVKERQKSIDLHKQWLTAAAELGCSQLRVNAYGDGSYLQQLRHCSESLKVLCDSAASMGISIVVENHGHPSSNGAWLAMLIESVERDNTGVYIDFDNFFMGGWRHSPKRLYDRYQGMEDLANITVGGSAKSYAFDQSGNETTVDFARCVSILTEAGFSGVLSAEYEGDLHSEYDGSAKTLALLNKVLN
ncbi:sugar phosphate isomerase/epimerase family protein [Agarivorans sp. MS3-6]